MSHMWSLWRTLRATCSFLDLALSSCLCQYLCHVQGFSAPVRQDCTDDGCPLQTAPGHPPRFLSWRDEALCNPPVWATLPNCGSHCCPSERKMKEIRAEFERRRLTESGEGKKLPRKNISRCTDVHWSKRDTKLRSFILPYHNGNLSSICFSISKSSLFMSLPLSIYTSLIKIGDGKKKVAAGFKASNCLAVVVGCKLDQMSWPSIPQWWNRPGGTPVSWERSIHDDGDIKDMLTNSHTQENIPTNSHVPVSKAQWEAHVLIRQ